MLTTQRTEHMVLTAVLGEREVRLMIDSGANQSYVSRSTGQWLRQYKRKKELPYSLTMANGSHARLVDECLSEIPLKIGQHEETVTLDITDLPKYDVVLGMAWLHRHNPTINWKTRTLEFTQCSANELGDRSSPKAPILARAIWVRPQGRQLAEISDEPTAHELPPEYQDFKELFKEREKLAALPEHKPWDHKIEFLEGQQPKHKGWQKRLSPKEDTFLRKYIKDNLAKGFIRKSKSPISHGMLFVAKKDGDLRPCVDFRPTNAITRRNQYPIPLISELQHRVGGKNWYSIFDVMDAFNRVRMAEGEEWKTAFTTPFGLWEYLVMPFGLTNAPATFQEFINDALKEYLGDFVVAYLDDILVFSDTYEQHVEHVRKVMKALQAKDLPLKLGKCEFHKHEVAFLGYRISNKGLGPDPAKVRAIVDWPIPQSVKDIQSFLGLANYYRQFILGYSDVAAPLTELTKKDVRFLFEKKCAEAFKELKRRLTIAPILRIFNHEKEAFVETDASDKAIGAVLNQKDENGKLVPTAYYSRKMTEPESNYDIHDKELLAIVEALRTWRVYLEGAKHPVQIYTDHKNLLYWTTTKELNRRQVRWSETLAMYDFKITHVRGTENGRADALSRRPDYMEGLEPEPASILKKEGNCLTYKAPKNQLALMDIDLTESQKQQVMQERHDQKTAGHKGVAKTIELITRDFNWKGIRKDVEDYIQKCDTCSKTKHERHKPYGLLQSPATPDKAWSSIAMDFVTGLPKSAEPTTGTEFDAILVIIDRLTGYAHMEPCLKTLTAEHFAYLLTKTVIAQHGTPEEIISDRDKLFTSNFWKSMADLLGIKHKLSTAYHPQTDGQTERTNQTMEQYLRCYVNYDQDNWVQLLPIAQLAFNNSTGPAGISPFYANHGFHPRIDRDPKGIQPLAEKANVSVSKLQALHAKMKTQIEQLRQRTAATANKKRSEGPDFQEGEMVYLSRKNIKTQRPSEKLDHTKLGPFRIRERKGPVTFKLDIPEHMKIHPVFHKSLLEPCHDKDATPYEPELEEDYHTDNRTPEKIMEKRSFWDKVHYLVHWSETDKSEDTWETEDALTQEFLDQYHHQQNSSRRPSRRQTPRGTAQTIMGMNDNSPPIQLILSRGNPPTHYLTKWTPTRDSEWLPKEQVPVTAIKEYHIHRVRIIRLPPGDDQLEGWHRQILRDLREDQPPPYSKQPPSLSTQVRAPPPISNQAQQRRLPPRGGVAPEPPEPASPDAASCWNDPRGPRGRR